MRAQYKTSVRGGAGVFPPRQINNARVAGVFPPRQISHICRRQMSIPHRQIHNARAAGVHFFSQAKDDPGDGRE